MGEFSGSVRSGAAFLGVTASARGFVWRERLDAAAARIAAAMAERHAVPELLGRVLAARGFGVEEVPVVLAPTIKALMPDPSCVRDMDCAAARLADAIAGRQKVAVFGDYDVDGAASSALMHRFLDHHGLQARLYIPDRMTEGYGPNAAAIERLIAEGAQLIVTVDCGTTSFAPLAAARRLKTDAIVVDHHQADPQLPEVVALVNPNRQDDLSGLGSLCAAGVAFLLLVAATRELRRRGAYAGTLAEPPLLEWLDVVALATVCDVVPLVGLNRAYVAKGLQVMAMRRNIGLKALCDAAGLDRAPTSYHLGFILGPRINAGGRIGEASLGARLLATADPLEAARIAALLDKLNTERKALEQQMLDEALAMADRLLAEAPDRPIVAVGSAHWHKGVVGLVASRLTERFQRPSCVVAWDAGDHGTGSLRSVPGVDIGGAVRAAVAAGHLVKGGGHAMAAGLTVRRDRFDEAIRFFDATLRTAAHGARAAAGLDFDGALTPAAATADLVALIERAGPYGQGNPQPRFAFPAHRVKFAKIAGQGHIRCALEAGDGSRLDAVAFRAGGQPLGDMLLATGGLPLHVAGTLRRDTWNGRDKIVLAIEDAADPRKQ
ncbi:MAG: single-stranded-DNA-specific exonuclease RecJ [Hyphomicrobiaceae bacterium]